MAKTKVVPSFPGLIDSHVHLNMDPLSSERDEVLARAKAAGLTHMLTIGTTLVESRQALDIAQAEAMVWATVGVHPHDVEGLQDEDLDTLRQMAGEPKVAAIGEIGLDFHYDHSPRDIQKAWFRRQMILAQELDLPVVIHTREAEADTEAILREFPKVTGVLHCFSSDPSLAQAGLEMGYYISFSGIVTFKKAERVQQAARDTPLDRMLVETDCPFLAPVPFRGKSNEPAYVAFVAQAIADLKGVSVEAVVAATAANTKKLFRLP